jgi:hypothetical protein
MPASTNLPTILLFLFIIDIVHAYLWNRVSVRTSRSFVQRAVTVVEDVAQLEGLTVSKQIAIANIQESSDSMLRGVIAIEQIAPNSIILSVPSSISLETTNTKPPTPFPDFVPQSLWENSLWDHRLAYKLLYEKEVLRESSDKHLWIKSLPKEFSTPYYWTDEEVSELQYQSIADRIKKQREDWLALYNRWKSSNLSKQEISLTSFIWALQCVNSRAFSGSYEGSSAKERRSLFLFTGLLTLFWPIFHLGTYEQSFGAAISVGLSILLRDLFVSKALNFKRYVMCPYIDMINHNSYAASDVSYNYFQDTFDVKSSGHEKNEQIFISYGKQSNDRLFQYYGFIEDSNPYDSYDFGVGPVELLLKYGADLNAAIPFPNDPAPAERLEVIAVALKNTPISQTKSQSRSNSMNIQGSEESVAIGSENRNNDMDSSPLTATADTISSKLYSRNQNNAKGVLLDEKMMGNYDEITRRCVRGLYCSPSEWKQLAPSSANFFDTFQAAVSSESELMTINALKMIAKLELEGKATSIDEDMTLLTGQPSTGFGNSKNKNSNSNKVNKKKLDTNPSGIYNDHRYLAISFRIEKKKILRSYIN